MIRKLTLARYGKFRDQSFELGEVTIFRGPNESGKTTIFDALSEKLCRPPRGNAPTAKQLRGRYGDDREASLERADGKPDLIPMDEFLGLYAIRSGAISFDASSDADWVGKVKANLFAGGVNPADFVRALEELASVTGTLKHNKDIKKIESQLGQTKAKLAQLRSQRESILGQEKELADTSARIAEKSQEIARTQKAFAELKARLEEQEHILLRRRLEDIQSSLSEHERLVQQIEGSKEFEHDQVAQLDSVAQRLSDLKEKAAGLQSEEKQVREQLAQVRARKRDAQQRAEVAQRTVALASRLAEQVGAAIQRTASKTVVRVRWGLVGAASVAMLLGALLAVLLPGIVPKVAGGGVALAALAVLGLFSRSVVVMPDTEGREAEKQRLMDEWANAGAPGGRPAVQTLEGLQEFFLGRKTEAAQAMLEPERLEAEAGPIEARLEQTMRSLAMAGEDLARAEREKHEWLLAHGAQDRDDYVRKVAAHQQSRERLRQNQGKLQDHCRELQLESVERLREEVHRKLAKLDEMGVPRRGLAENELQRLRLEIRNTERALDAAKNQLAEMQAREGKKRGLMLGSLGQLPEQIAAAERHQAALVRELDDKLLDRRAAGLAKELVATIGQDVDQVFDEMAAVIRQEFATSLGLGREVKVAKLDEAGISATDAEGALRPLTHLSQGTRDCFVLAARLALARKTGWDGGVLVLDEPFHTLDSARRASAVQMLKRYREQSRSQIVVFTKDEGLAEEIKSAFSADGVWEHVLQAQAR